MEPKRSRTEKAPTRPTRRRKNNLYGCQRTYSLFIESNCFWWLKCRISLIQHVTHDDDILSRTSSHYALECETRPINLSITSPFVLETSNLISCFFSDFYLSTNQFNSIVERKEIKFLGEENSMSIEKWERVEKFDFVLWWKWMFVCVKLESWRAYCG